VLGVAWSAGDDSAQFSGVPSRIESTVKRAADTLTAAIEDVGVDEPNIRGVPKGFALSRRAD